MANGKQGAEPVPGNHAFHRRAVRRIRKAERMNRIAELARIGKLTHAEIAAEVGLAKQTVENYIVEIVRKWNENVESKAPEVRARILARYEHLYASAEEKLAKEGDPKWHDQALKTLGKICDLMGFDAPKQIAIEENKTLAILSVSEIRQQLTEDNEQLAKFRSSAASFGGNRGLLGHSAAGDGESGSICPSGQQRPLAVGSAPEDAQ